MPELRWLEVRWFLLSLAVSLVATCGQKGPLYLPGEDSALTHAEHRLRPV